MTDIVRIPLLKQQSSLRITTSTTTTAKVERQPLQLHNRCIPSIPTTPTATATNHDREFRAYFNSPQQRLPEEVGDHRHSRQLLYNKNSSSISEKQNTTKKLIFDSPRLYESDAVLFPSSKHGPLRNMKYLQSYESRYQYIQQQQRQSNKSENKFSSMLQNDMTTLNIHYDMIHIRQILPKCIQYGIVPSCSSRIQTLFIPLLPKRHEKKVAQSGASNRSVLKSIVSWMDVISTTFPNLKHIYIEPQSHQYDDSDLNESISTVAVALSAATVFGVEEVQLLRTYVLYRLPSLLSIDGTIITSNARASAKDLFLPHSQPQHEKDRGRSNRRISTDSVDDVNSKHQQARVKKIASQMTRTKTINNKKRLKKNTSIRKNVGGGSPLTYCLLDGMLDHCSDDDDKSERNENDKSNCNDNRFNKLSMPVENSRNVEPQKRILLISDDAVEIVKQQSPEKKQKPKKVVQHYKEQQVQYISIDDHESSSVHAINACSAWTNVCGSLSTLYCLSSRINKTNKNSNICSGSQNDTSREDSPTDDEKNNDKMPPTLQFIKTDRIKTKFHLLKQNRLRRNHFIQPEIIEEVKSKELPLSVTETSLVDLSERGDKISSAKPRVSALTTSGIIPLHDANGLGDCNQNKISRSGATIDQRPPYLLRHIQSSPTKLPSAFVFPAFDIKTSNSNHLEKNRLPPTCPGYPSTSSTKPICHSMSLNICGKNDIVSPSTPCIPRCSSAADIPVTNHPSNASESKNWLDSTHGDTKERYEEFIVKGTSYNITLQR